MCPWLPYGLAGSYHLLIGCPQKNAWLNTAQRLCHNCRAMRSGCGKVQLLQEADPMHHDACPCRFGDWHMARLSSNRQGRTPDNPLLCVQGG